MVPSDLRTRVGVLLQREAVLDLLGQHAARRRDLAELESCRHDQAPRAGRAVRPA